MIRVVVCDTRNGPEVFKLIDDALVIGVVNKTRVSQRIFPMKKVLLSLTGTVCGHCPLCEKPNDDVTGYSAMVVRRIDDGTLDVALIDAEGFGGLLGQGGEHQTHGYHPDDYMTVLKIRPFNPLSPDYLSSRIAELGLNGTMYEQAIRMHFLEFADKKDVSENLKVHRTTVARAINKIASVCRLCGY